MRVNVLVVQTFSFSLWHAPKLNYNQDDEIGAEWNAKGMNLPKGAYLKVMM
jgi:hypothetical protein